MGGHTEQADYTAFYTGWTIVADGHGPDLYDIGTQTATQQAILGGRSFEAGLNPFNNPPHLVVPFVPLAALPMATSYLAWGAIQIGLLAWLVWRLWSAVAADVDARRARGPRRGLAGGLAADHHVPPGGVLAARLRRRRSRRTSPCGGPVTAGPARGWSSPPSSPRPWPASA